MLEKMSLSELRSLYWDKFTWSCRLDEFFQIVPEKYVKKFIISQLKTFCDEYKEA